MSDPKPNVLFLFTDDQRFDTVGALGNDTVRTPHMDDLVQRGTAFTRAHIPGGTRGAVCMPSRAMLHTGRTLFHLSGSGETIPPEHTTIGEAFRAAGYQTFGSGKWHNGRESYHRSFTDGAEIFFGGMADHWNVPAYDYDPTGRYDAALPFCPDPMGSNEVKRRGGDHMRVGRHSSEVLADAAIDFLGRRQADKPFFAYVSFLAPHDPRTMPQKYLDMYDPDEIELPPNFMGGHPFDNGELHVRDEMLAGFPRTPHETRRHIAEYYAMITHLDAHIGRVLDALRENGLTEDTIVVLAGDNGLAVGQHGLFGKQSCYDHSVRVPLVFAGPGVPQGEQRDAFAYLLDVFPTLCDLTGVGTPGSVEGRSLAGVLREPTETVRDSLFFGYRGLHRAVRDERFKLIEYVVDGEHVMTQLFDLQNDPWELNNLAGEAEHGGKLRELRSELTRYRDEWNDADSRWGREFWEGYSHD
ncbi:MAG: sulfatase-like hydrolase/transferase [Candidatus Brocadiia bacterium]